MKLNKMKEKISVVLSWYGCMEKVWWILFKLHLDAVSRRGGAEKNIEKEMLKSCEFYRENKARIKHVLHLLSDDLSKRILCNQIHYRQSYDRKFAKPYNMRNQYFPKDIVCLGKKETFIDCGAFVGDTVSKFRKKTSGKYERVVCFEPDMDNFMRLKKHMRRDKRVAVYNKGCWKESTVLRFDNTGSMASRLSDMEDAIEIQVCRLDEIPECRKASFIKMDIEGSEYNALLGAKEIIKKNRPILAVCIYHSDEDMLRIPELLGSMCNDYLFFIRQHGFFPMETVCYAVPYERRVR